MAMKKHTNPADDDLEVIEQDIITDTLKTISALCDKNEGKLDESVIEKADQAIRAKWWGDRPYIARRPGEGSSERNQAIMRDYQRGERICYLANKYQISRKQVTRIIQSAKNGTSLS